MPAVVDGLPVVPEAKHEKLAGVLNKIYSQIGHVREGKQQLFVGHSDLQSVVLQGGLLTALQSFTACG